MASEDNHMEFRPKRHRSISSPTDMVSALLVTSKQFMDNADKISIFSASLSPTEEKLIDVLNQFDNTKTSTHNKVNSCSLPHMEALPPPLFPYLKSSSESIAYHAQSPKENICFAGSIAVKHNIGGNIEKITFGAILYAATNVLKKTHIMIKNMSHDTSYGVDVRCLQRTIGYTNVRKNPQDFKIEQHSLLAAANDHIPFNVLLLLILTDYKNVMTLVKKLVIILNKFIEQCLSIDYTLIKSNINNEINNLATIDRFKKILFRAKQQNIDLKKIEIKYSKILHRISSKVVLSNNIISSWKQFNMLFESTTHFNRISLLCYTINAIAKLLIDVINKHDFNIIYEHCIDLLDILRKNLQYYLVYLTME